ncbi:MAG: hypothetical protein OEY33_09730, partial [Bdellovibrionales bacterium]|nr:hypothetical protein [Bdellovibrionales bacterium]
FGDSDADTSIDTDVDIDVDIDIDTDISIDGAESDIGHDHSHGHGNDSAAPLLLLLSTFFLMFGSIGYPLYQSESLTMILRLIITFISPLFFVKLVSFIWRKYLANEFAYEVPKVKIDNEVKTLTRVDEKGGLVLADTADIDRVGQQLHFAGHIKMQAKTLPGVEIERDTKAFVIAIEPNDTLIIDLWPKPPSK